jgi:hypothetical protein
MSRWRANEQERLAKDAGHPRPDAPETEAGGKWNEIVERFHGRRNSTRDARK